MSKKSAATSLLPDAEARRRIVADLDRTLFVEAGAGSGKTKSLVDRMIALLKAGRCSIGTLAAVTFTRKAAAELRGRFQVELEKAVAGETNPVVRARLENALQNLEQCYIGTIHSFCAKLLRERPIEIGLDPGFSEMEEIEDDLFREQCWQEYLVKVRVEEGGEEILRGLDEAGLEPEDLRDGFDAVSLYPEVKIVGGRQEIPDYAMLRAKLEQFLARARRAMPRQKPAKGYDFLQRLMVRAFIRQKNLGFDDHRVLMETFEILDKEGKVTQNRWPSKEQALAFKEEFENFRAEVVAPALQAWREYRHERILRFLQPAIEFYEARRKEESRLNFQDLLLQASRLLRDNPEVRRYFSRKFTHVLVDEFQDTDPIQAEVLLYLKAGDGGEKDWMKLTPEPGSLFLVGDPKQSIYRFRRADIDIYNRVKGMVEEAEGGGKGKGGGEAGSVLNLTSNFRSLRVLAHWNNAIFESVLPATANRYQAAYAPIETVREDEAGCTSGVYKIIVPKVAHNKGAEIAAMDAAAIADWIGWACAGNLKLARSDEERQKGLGPEARPSDFLILFRYKKNMDMYARALEERGIPFEITGSDAFAEAEEIREITNLAIALNDPDNPIYTVAVLRGIFCGVSDEDLVEFKRQGGRFNFMSPGKEIVECKHLGAVNVVLALQKMKAWREWTVRFPASAALHRIFEDSGILNYLASKEMGSSRVGNVLKLLEIVRNEERKGVTSFAGAVKLLEELAEVREIEEISLTPARENAVRLMNLHKAKGLEAPVVFLANPAPSREHEVDKHVVRVEPEEGGEGENPELERGRRQQQEWREKRGQSQEQAEQPRGQSRPQGYFVFCKPGAYGKRGTVLSQPVGWEEAAEEEKKYQRAEEQRLMYVAATRARNMLVVSTYDGGGGNKPWLTLDRALAEVPEVERVREGEFAAGEKKQKGRDARVDIQTAGDAAEIRGAAGRGREKVTIKKAEVEGVRKTIAANLERAAGPTYAVESVTSLARKEREMPLRRRDAGLGLSWGRLVHHVLEAIGSGRLPIPASRAEQEKLELFIDNILAAEERDRSDKEMLVSLIESILRSDLWRRVMSADKKFFEIPFSIRTSKRKLAGRAEFGSEFGGEFGGRYAYPSDRGASNNSLESGGEGRRGQGGRNLDASGKKGMGSESGEGSEGDMPVILSGAIDLVFWEDGKDERVGKEMKERKDRKDEKDTRGGEDEKSGKKSREGGWVIVDYKTDKIPISEAALESIDREPSIERIRTISPEFASIIDYYAPQVRLYARFWNQITGEPVREAGLYFTSINRWVGI